MSKRVERTIISIIGRTNAGKSSLLNLLSGQQDYAIVDETPGTTADTVTALMEIHSMGPFKIFDTAGIDEYSLLGEKKRKKALEALEESDLCLLKIDLLKALATDDLSVELSVIDHAGKWEKQVLAVYNIIDRDEKLTDAEIATKKLELDAKLGHPSIAIRSNDMTHQEALITFIKTNFQHQDRNIDLLPGIHDKGFVVLVIPMDEETPTLRLLRPQDMAVERLLRNFVIPVLFRLDLAKARSADNSLKNAERPRYTSLLQTLAASAEGLQLVITDSQALTHWTDESIPLTSFSVMMANYMSYGNLHLLAAGARAFADLAGDDKVLIVEACNHNRKCDDIGTVQLPKIIKKHAGEGIRIEFCFGRTFPEDISEYSLIVHCGACMIDRQKFLRRIVLANRAGVPFTNYGFLLSYVQNASVLDRVLKPFFADEKKLS